MLRFNFLEREESLLERLFKPDIILALLILAAWVGFAFYYVGSLKEKKVSLQQENVKLTTELNRLKKVEREEKELKKTREILKNKLTVISKLDSERNVPDYFYLFSKREFIPKGVWLNVVKKDKEKLYIDASAYNLDLVSKFLKNAEDNLGNVTFKATNFIEEKFGKKDNDVSINRIYKYYRFQFDVEMK